MTNIENNQPTAEPDWDNCPEFDTELIRLVKLRGMDRDSDDSDDDSYVRYTESQGYSMKFMEEPTPINNQTFHTMLLRKSNAIEVYFEEYKHSPEFVQLQTNEFVKFLNKKNGYGRCTKNHYNTIRLRLTKKEKSAHQLVFSKIINGDYGFDVTMEQFEAMFNILTEDQLNKGLKSIQDNIPSAWF